MPHWFCPITDICCGCGLSAQKFVEDAGRPYECPDDDHKSYLLARHRLEALVGIVFGEGGETKH